MDDPASQKMVSFLERRGFQEKVLHFGDDPLNDCVEKARGGPLTGVDVVRICHDGTGRFKVLHFNTHGVGAECYKFDPETGRSTKCLDRR